jgi:hypothetical protein
MNRHLFTVKRVILAVVALLVLVVVLSVTLSGGHKTTAVVKPVTTPTNAPLPPISAPAAPTTQAPPAPAPSTPSTPAMTPTQQQAVEAAQQYLTGGEGFSAEGLLQQLTSSYGNGFSAADAQFAINYLNPNWDAQAVESAQGYMQTEPGWSQSGLEQQLTSTYGSGFTQAQADYAVNKVLP